MKQILVKLCQNSIMQKDGKSFMHNRKLGTMNSNGQWKTMTLTNCDNEELWMPGNYIRWEIVNRRQNEQCKIPFLLYI